ncbi:hypothetical protein SDJN02_06141, partial [Cucurbita argyrosperma subsp. argyrosperma]
MERPSRANAAALAAAAAQAADSNAAWAASPTSLYFFLPLIESAYQLSFSISSGGLSLGGQAAATELRQNEPGRISPGAGLQGQRAERWPD